MSNFGTYKETIKTAINEKQEGKENFLPGINFRIKNIKIQNDILEKLRGKAPLSKQDKEYLEGLGISSLNNNEDELKSKIHNLILKNKSFLKALKDLKNDIKEGLKKGVFKNFGINNLDIFYHNTFLDKIDKNINSLATVELDKTNIGNINKIFNKILSDKYNKPQNEIYNLKSYIQVLIKNGETFDEYKLAIVDGNIYELKFDESNSNLLDVIKSRNFKLDGLKLVYLGKVYKEIKTNNLENNNIKQDKKEIKEKIDEESIKRGENIIKNFLKESKINGFHEKANLDLGFYLAKHVQPEDLYKTIVDIHNYVKNRSNGEKDGEKYYFNYVFDDIIYGYIDGYAIKKYTGNTLDMSKINYEELNNLLNGKFKYYLINHFIKYFEFVDKGKRKELESTDNYYYIRELYLDYYNEIQELDKVPSYNLKFLKDN